ncbi:MAG TPA: hypothetical protein VFT04_08540 [Gemmatimonadales bacterium]|nr:hypothetical protein [Gemmatimonadales bacterium]
MPLSIGSGIAGGVLAALIARRLLEPVPDIAVARYVDRAVPGTEESAELVLREGGLTLVEQLQRRRVEAALDRVELPKAPDRGARHVAASGIVALIGAIAISLLPDTTAGSTATGPAGQEGAADVPARLTEVSVEIRPPRYTAIPIRTQDGLEIDAEEGAEIRWRLRTSGQVRAPRLVTSAGDTIALIATAGELEARVTARRSLLYQVLLDSTPESPEIHRLTVRLDGAPEVTVLRPAPRSELRPGVPLRVPVEVLATDDHGAASAELVATVTTGSGESVRFREQRVPFPAPRPARGGSLFRMALDLAALGMAPGDELYFHVLARDRRPEPNVGRSATVFISLADTAVQSPPLVAGVALPVAPEYFRSQRQIIIDTERLIADAPRLPTDIFRERANAIGIDQGLLRLRYGEFTGEEFAGEVQAGETHEHDSEENATLLADSVKATLKGAIAEMWEAELRLRTYRPKEALPYEYRALELLKAVQQSSRAYVQRVGFEPPPLEIDRRRLTGDLGDVRSRTVNDSAETEDPRSATREALALLRELERGVRAAPADRASLAAAEEELARLAVEGDGAQLDALRHVRRLRASLADGVPCDGCIAAAESALVASLPPPPASASPRGAGTALARRYAEILRGAR